MVRLNVTGLPLAAAAHGNKLLQLLPALRAISLPRKKTVGVQAFVLYSAPQYFFQSPFCRCDLRALR